MRLPHHQGSLSNKTRARMMYRFLHHNMNKWLTSGEIMDAMPGGCACVSTYIHDIRMQAPALGYIVEHRRNPARKHIHEYRLVRAINGKG